jgi:phage baseplate assembly protein W
MAEALRSIRYPLAVDAGLGRLEEEANYAAHVEQLIMQVLYTSPGERVNRPDFGCGVKRMLFAPNSEVAAGLAQVAIFEAMRRWLGSVLEVNDVTARAVNETLEVRIAYTLKVRRERRYLNLEVTL